MKRQLYLSRQTFLEVSPTVQRSVTWLKNRAGATRWITIQANWIEYKWNTIQMQCNTKTNQLDRIQNSFHVRDTVVLIEKHLVSVKDYFPSRDMYKSWAEMQEKYQKSIANRKYWTLKVLWARNIAREKVLNGEKILQAKSITWAKVFRAKSITLGKVLQAKSISWGKSIVGKVKTSASAVGGTIEWDKWVCPSKARLRLWKPYLRRQPSLVF